MNGISEAWAQPGTPLLGLESERRNKLNGSGDLERVIRSLITVSDPPALEGHLLKEDFTCFVKRLVLLPWLWW
jgi:hypothetical protein